MDRYPRELSISREWWYREITGGEGFPEGCVEPKLHAGGFRKVLLEGVDDGPVVLAHIKRDEVSYPVVTWATTEWDVCMCGNPGWGEVASASPPGGCFP